MVVETSCPFTPFRKSTWIPSSGLDVVASTTLPENEKDLVEIPKAILKKLDIHPVATIDDVLELALVESPKPLAVGLETKKEPSGKDSDVITTH